MAKTIARSKDTDPGLYDDDFYVWTQRQAKLLRAGRFAELDLPRLIEEVEDLGTSQRSEVFSRSQQILQHFLKLQFSPAIEPRDGWLQSIDDQRDDMELVITPSLRRELEQTLSERYARAAAGLAGLRQIWRDGRPAGELSLHGRADPRPGLVSRQRARDQ